MQRRTLLKTGLLGLGATLGAPLGLTACGRNRSDGRTEISVWTVTQEAPQKAAFTELIAEFERSNPTLAVRVEERSTDQHKAAMRQVAGTDNGPDIYWYWEGSGLGGELVGAEMSLELTAQYERFGWVERFTPASLAGITQYGGYHGVPWTLQGEGIYYNKTLFAKAGVTAAPTTYDELVAAADALKAAGITPIEFGGTVNWHVMRLLDCLIEMRCGAELADRLTTGDGDWAREPLVTEAFADLERWGANYLNPGYMGISDSDASQLFFTGRAAMALEGTWFNAQVTSNGLDPAEIGIFPFPTGTDRLYGFGEAFYINAQSRQPDAAALFLDFITSDAGQAIAGSNWAAISVNAAVPVDDSNPLNAVWADIFANAKSGMFTNNDQNFSTVVTTEFWRVQNSVLTGDLTPELAGAEFQRFRAAHSTP
ncbi:extracellular solute-binding protein [Micrococcales bacterium 31B]|nr:extracellular solute-binding protein [Micrococcales bacterium 31B]